MAKRPNLFGNLNIASIDETNNNESAEIASEEVLEHIKFEFEADEETLNYLKNQTYRLHLTMSKSYTELGKIFKDTQEKLSGIISTMAYFINGLRRLTSPMILFTNL